jgi:hypothetical protein
LPTPSRRAKWLQAQKISKVSSPHGSIRVIIKKSTCNVYGYSTERRDRDSCLDRHLTKGIRAKDVNGVMSLYAEEKVQFLLAPPLKYSGANAIKAEDLQDWFSSFQGPIGYEIRDLEVATGKQIAFCTP